MLEQVLALCHHLWDVGEKGVSMNASHFSLILLKTTGSISEIFTITDNRNLTVGN